MLELGRNVGTWEECWNLGGMLELGRNVDSVVTTVGCQYQEKEKRIQKDGMLHTERNRVFVKQQRRS
jgi:hypothetical protein